MPLGTVRRRSRDVPAPGTARRGGSRRGAVLARLGAASAAHARLVVAVWLVLAAAAAALVPGLLQRLSPPPLELRGSASAEAAALIARSFPHQGDEQLVLAFDSATLRSRDPRYQRAVAAVVEALHARPDIGGLQPLPSPAQVNPHHAYVMAGVHGDERARQRNLPGQIATAARAARDASGGTVTVALVGVSPVFAELIRADLDDLRRMELVTVPLILFLLVVGLGAAGAVAVPLLVAGGAGLLSLGVLALGGAAIGIDSTLLTATVTICLALGLDYCLLILLRYRQGRREGGGPREAAAHAVATAGSTVCWCATIIMITAACMLIIPAPAVLSMALAAVLAAFLTLTAALTLAPALLVLLDRRLEPTKRLWRRARRDDRPPAWLRMAGHLMRRPGRYALAAALLLLLAAVPALDLRLGLHFDRHTLARTDVGHGLAQMEDDHLANLTLLALPHAPGAGPVDPSALTAALERDPRVTMTGAIDNGRDLTLVTIAGRGAPDSTDAADLVRDIGRTAQESLPAGQRVLMTGAAAMLAEVYDEMRGRAWQVIALVLLASFVLLLITFRSLLIPLKAIAMNLLSVGATLGLVTLCFQGTGSTGDINAAVPLLALTVVFGLSMDYEVFLVHRIAEHYRRTGDNTAAVLHGLRHTARPITLAAAIIAVTFAGLLFTHRHDFQQAGFAVAVAIIIDATLIRMVLVPALMRLLGHRNWWLPRPLARLLPPLRPVDGPPTG
ncbi:MMPL family transporter [Nonomuraea sp. NPDC049725]|uniref:MMPL family transporter n=1 Tax=Nonomuraea sp. NPDC049725 TaxID=3154508 RepID=UPI0034186F10